MHDSTSITCISLLAAIRCKFRRLNGWTHRCSFLHRLPWMGQSLTVKSRSPHLIQNRWRRGRGHSLYPWRLSPQLKHALFLLVTTWTSFSRETCTSSRCLDIIFLLFENDLSSEQWAPHWSFVKSSRESRFQGSRVHPLPLLSARMVVVASTADDICTPSNTRYSWWALSRCDSDSYLYNGDTLLVSRMGKSCNDSFRISLNRDCELDKVLGDRFGYSSSSWTAFSIPL